MARGGNKVGFAYERGVGDREEWVRRSCLSHVSRGATTAGQQRDGGDGDDGDNVVCCLAPNTHAVDVAAEDAGEVDWCCGKALEHEGDGWSMETKPSQKGVQE